MKGTILAFGGAAVALLSGAAQAQTYDAFTSFDGTQGAGGFYYGEIDATSGVFNQFGANTNCFISGSTCLQLAANGDVPGFTKSDTPSFQYGTVNVPTDRLLAHPDDDADTTAVLFQTPAAGKYRVTATFNVQDIAPTGVDISYLFASNNTYPIFFTPLASIGSGNMSYTYSALVSLGANDIVGFGLGNGGQYFNDSTGVNFSLSAVPEPATWALMIVGFGMVGGAMRRRSAKTAVRFA